MSVVGPNLELRKAGKIMTTFKIFRNKTDLTHEQVDSLRRHDFQRVVTPTNFGMPR
jgi:hypothetical protein